MFARVMLAIGRAVDHIDRGQPDAGAVLLEEAHAAAAAVGDRFLIGCALCPLGMARLEQGRVAEAVAALKAAMAHFVVLDAASLLVNGRICLGIALLRAGDPAGVDHLREAATVGGDNPSEQAVGAGLWALAAPGSAEAREWFDRRAAGSEEPLLLALRARIDRGDPAPLERLTGVALYARMALAVARPS